MFLGLSSATSSPNVVGLNVSESINCQNPFIFTTCYYNLEKKNDISYPLSMKSNEIWITLQKNILCYIKINFKKLI